MPRRSHSNYVGRKLSALKLACSPPGWGGCPGCPGPDMGTSSLVALIARHFLPYPPAARTLQASCLLWQPNSNMGCTSPHGLVCTLTTQLEGLAWVF